MAKKTSKAPSRRDVISKKSKKRNLNSIKNKVKDVGSHQKPSLTKEQRRQRTRRNKIIGLTAAFVFILAFAVYVHIAGTYRDRFLPHSMMNGISVSKLTADEAKQTMKQAYRDYELAVTFRRKTGQTIRGADVDYHYDLEKVDEYLAQQNRFAWFPAYFSREIFAGNLPVSYHGNDLKGLVLAFPQMQENNMILPKNAYTGYADGEFSVVPEVMGTVLHPDVALEAIQSAMEDNERTLNLAHTQGVYESPDVYSTNKKLAAAVPELNELAAISLTYDLPGKKKRVLDGNELQYWLSKDGDGHYKRDEALWDEKITEYVKSLEEDVDTVYVEHPFRTMSGRVVTLPADGYYGWKIDEEKEIAQLKEDLVQGNVVEREPVFRKREAADPDNNYGFGDTYCEVNLGAQHLWIVKKGKVVFQTDFVSGKNTPERKTPAGAFFAYDKQTNKTMQGDRQVDGSYGYTSHCKYWIRLTTYGVGLHDAPWRNRFGGSIWLTNGSHGCVNLPSSAAPKVYEEVDAGMPVAMYY